MQPNLIFNCFKLCSLIVFCTAAPASDSDSSSNADLSSDTDAADRGKIVKLLADENPKDAVNEGLSGDEGAYNNQTHGADGDNAVQDNEEPVNTDEQDAPPIDEPIDEEKQHDAVDDKENPVNADEQDAPATADPIDEEKHDKEEEEEEPINEDEQNAPAENEVHDDSSNATEEPNSAKQLMEVENNNNEIHVNDSGIDDLQDGKDRDLGYLFDLPAGFKLSPAEMTKFKIWPEAKIPYYIDELSYDKVLRDKIRHYLDVAISLTGLQFEELSEPPELDDDRWVFFINRRGQLDCKDYNTNSFTNRGVQKVIIGYNCLQHGGPMAAIVLALVGVPPQHNAPNRDKYIKVDTDHILPEKRGLFKRLKDGDWLFHDLEYDHYSVSHYNAHKYTADGSETIKLSEAGGLKQRRQRSRKSIGTGLPIRFGTPSIDIQDMALYNEVKTYSATDLFKIMYLYSNIIQNKPRGIKAQDCKALYRAGPNFKKMKLTQPIKSPERPKPAKYLAAIKDDNSPDKLLSHPINVKGELLSDLDDD